MKVQVFTRRFIHDKTIYTLTGNEELAMSHFHELRAHLHNMKQTNIQNLPILSGIKEFDDGTVAYFQLVYGKENIDVFAPKITEEESEEVSSLYTVQEDEELVIPMLRVYDAPMGNPVGWAVYYEGKLIDGTCFFYELNEDAEIEDLGIEYTSLANAIKNHRTGSLGESKCVPMRCRDDYTNMFYVNYDYGEDLLPACINDYECLDLFEEDLPNFEDVKLYRDDTGAPELLAGMGMTNCSSSLFDNTIIIEGNFTRYNNQDYSANRYVRDDEDNHIADSVYLEGWRVQDNYDKAYFFFEMFNNTPTPCWEQNEITDDPLETLKWRRGHCPELEDMGFWSDVGSNIHFRGGHSLMQTWYTKNVRTTQYNLFNDYIQNDYGDGYASYDPDIDIWFSLRGSCSHHHNIQTVTPEGFTCEYSPYQSSKYIKTTAFNAVDNVGYSVSYRLLLKDEEQLCSFSHTMGWSGNVEDSYYHDWVADVAGIFDSKGTVFFSPDKKKSDSLYHSANFADATCYIDTNEPPDFSVTIYCGVIAFTSSENEGGKTPSFLIFDNLETLDYDVGGSGITGADNVNGVYVPLNIGKDGSKYVLITSNEGGPDWDTPELPDCWFGDRVWDRFVVRYTFTGIQEEKNEASWTTEL